MVATHSWLVLVIVWSLLLLRVVGQRQTQGSRLQATIDAGAEPDKASLTKFWQASVGSGHARLGLRADWQQQLKAVHDDTGIHGVRFHGTFDDDMEPVVTNDPAAVSGLVYNFTLLDQLYDGILAAGMHPIVELSFMPSAIANCTVNTTGATHCRTWLHYHALEESPRVFTLWEALVGTFVRHLVNRYGLREAHNSQPASVIKSSQFRATHELHRSWIMPTHTQGCDLCMV